MSSEQEILLSRQAALFGDNTLTLLHCSSVLIININEIALEIGKNLCLSGVDKIYLFNDSDHKIIDYSSNENFKLLQNNSHKSSLVWLNNDPCSKDYEDFELLINRINPTIALITDGILTSEKLKQWNQICRKQKIPFLLIQSYGLISSLFVDMGDSYTFATSTPEFQIKKIISHIDHESGVITIVDKHHQFSLNSYIKFSKLTGCEELMNNGPFKVIELVSRDQFRIDVPNNLSAYQQGGCCEEVSITVSRTNKSLEDNLNNPQCESPTYFASGNIVEYLIYYFLLGISLFREAHHRLPEAHDNHDFLEIYKEIETNFPGIRSHLDDENSFFKKAIFQASGKLPPMNSIIGGIASHECLKIINKTHEVINQWFWIERISLLADNFLTIPQEEFQSKNRKYRGMIRIFGQEIQDKLFNRKIFLAGSGALGCEFLKLCSMMGVACGPEGKIYLTDPDDISPSNLHRQLLFNVDDIRKSKSLTATNKLLELNGDIHIDCYTTEVSFSSLHNTFTFEKIWENTDEIFGALDTVDARSLLYLISSSFSIPFIDSGTRGSGCNTRLYYSPITSPFQKMGNAEEFEINCLGKEFPFRPRHTISWAKDLYLKLFYTSIHLFNNEPNIKTNKYILHDIGEKLLNQNTTDLILSFESVIKGKYNEKKIWSLELYRKLFEEFPNEILKSRPLDSLDPTKGSSEKFWGGIRIPPKVVPFDENDDLCNEFINSTITLLDHVFPLFSDAVPCPFDKDNQQQINFIFAAGNLFSRVYGIPDVSKLQTQMIAGEIIPAIITTTSICVGFALLDYFKLLQILPSRYQKLSRELLLEEQEELIYHKFENYQNYSFLATQNKLILSQVTRMTEKEKSKEIFQLIVKKDTSVQEFLQLLNLKYKIETLRIYFPESDTTLIDCGDPNDQKLYDILLASVNFSTINIMVEVEYLAMEIENTNYLSLYFER